MRINSNPVAPHPVDLSNAFLVENFSLPILFLLAPESSYSTTLGKPPKTLIQFSIERPLHEGAGHGLDAPGAFARQKIQKVIASDLENRNPKRFGV